MAPSLHSAIIATVVLLVVGQCSNAVPTEAEVFWRTTLPDSPLPESIIELLHPETSFVNKPKDDTDAEAFSQTLIYSPRQSSPKPCADDDITSGCSFVNKPKDDTDAEAFSKTLIYSPNRQSSNGDAEAVSQTLIYSPSPSRRQSSPKPSVDDDITKQKDDTDAEAFSRTLIYSPSRRQSSPEPSVGGGHDHLARGVFFHEEAVEVGKTITLYFPSAASAPPLGLLPRHVAASIPFSMSSLPSALARLGIARNSVQAASMEETLQMCEQPPIAGEAKFCATSLEALVQGSMAALGTHHVGPVTSDVPRSGAPKQPYTVRAVRPVDGSSFVSCHRLHYPYTVYMCHRTGSTRAYMVEVEGSLVATVAAICHTNTSHWDPEHVSFKVLGTKPGSAPVCHYLPYGHIAWVNKEANRGSSS